MRITLVGWLFPLAFVLAFSSGCGNAAANSTQQTQAGQLAQAFTLTTSTAADYLNPSGALEMMPATSLTFQAQAPGFVTVSFNARGGITPSGNQFIPIVVIECHIDGQPCQPDTNTVEFLYPQFCCDTRSFHWVAQNVSAGSHTVDILWGMNNPTSATVSNRSLIVENFATP